VKPLPRWRVAAALVVVAGLAVFGFKVVPIYIHNLQVQSFVGALTARSENLSQNDELLRSQVLDRARALDLPVQPGNVQVVRREGAVRIDVRYVVRVDLPGYTVDLHFYPGAGSR
jgi:hypothetical protein